MNNLPNATIMKNTNEKKSNDKSGEAFVNQQQAVDKAKNERIKPETDSGNLDPKLANNPSKRNLKTDTGQKKTGGGKQSSLGD
jgi:hypothetical protein